MNINTIANIKSKKFIHFVIGCGILLYSLIKVNAQQLPVYSQYTFNHFLLNPAAAGADRFTTLTITNRNQWVGVEGAPRKYSASIQSRIMRQKPLFKNTKMKKRNKHRFYSGRIGLGLNIQNFHAGQIDQTGVQFTYAYHYTLKRKSQLSIGISPGFYMYKINTNNMELIDLANDPIYNNKISFFIPDANIGIYYSDHNKYIGLSALQLFQAAVNFGIYENENFRIYRQYYLAGGYKFSLYSGDVIEPSFYIKSSDQLNLQMDVSLKYIYDSKFWIGFGYRSGSTFIVSTGICINSLYFGYAFDFSPKGILNSSYGSHEIMLSLRLGENNQHYKYLNRY